MSSDCVHQLLHARPPLLGFEGRGTLASIVQDIEEGNKMEWLHYVYNIRPARFTRAIGRPDRRADTRELVSLAEFLL